MKENISITDIMKVCLKRWYLIVVITVALTVGAYLLSAFVIPPMYKSSGQIHAKNTSFASETVTDVTTGELNAGEKLGITFIEMLKNDTFLSKVKNMGNFDLSPATMRGMLVFQQPEDTAIINIRVNSKDPNEAYMLLQEILRHAPAYLEGEMEGTTVKVLQEGKLETEPYSPNTTRNVLVGVLIGIAAGIVLCLCLEFFNKKIELAEEVEEAYGYPILGEIPNLKGGRGSGVY